jgi:CheY-like chemotaxis protein
MVALFVLPLNLQTVLSESEPVQPAQNLESLNGLTILLVDDDLDTRDFQAFLLEQTGARVIAAESGREVLQILDHTLPDVIVSDLGMPEMDGYTLMQQIRSRTPDRGGEVPAIAVSAYAGDANQQEAFKVGFQKHLAKPIEAERLICAIVELSQL